MTTYDKRDSRGWKTVKHGAASSKPYLPRMSLKQAEELGLHTGPELIIHPMPIDSPKQSDDK
jgi:hypothetical protein